MVTTRPRNHSGISKSGMLSRTTDKTIANGLTIFFVALPSNARTPSPVARRPSPVARRPSPVARRPSPCFARATGAYSASPQWLQFALKCAMRLSLHIAISWIFCCIGRPIAAVRSFVLHMVAARCRVAVCTGRRRFRFRRTTPLTTRAPTGSLRRESGGGSPVSENAVRRR